MKIYVCMYCYRIIGCQENDEVKNCLDCEKYIYRQLPCENYLVAKTIFKDAECDDCLTERLKLMN